MTPLQLRISRINKHWTQAEAAKFCGVSRQTYNNWENERNTKGIPPHVAMRFGFSEQAGTSRSVEIQRHAVLKALGMQPSYTEREDGSREIQFWYEPAPETINSFNPPKGPLKTT